MTRLQFSIRGMLLLSALLCADTSIFVAIFRAGIGYAAPGLCLAAITCTGAILGCLFGRILEATIFAFVAGDLLCCVLVVTRFFIEAVTR